MIPQLSYEYLLAILPIIVGSLTVLGVFWGPRLASRWSEGVRRRREHSLKLKEQALDPWLANLERYCRMGRVSEQDFNGVLLTQDGQIIPRNTESPSSLEYFNAMLSHLETGHQELVSSWNMLEHEVSNYNKKHAEFISEIKTSVTNKMKMPVYFLGEEPERFVSPHRIADLITDRLLNATPADVDRSLDHSQVVETTSGSLVLNWGPHSSLMKSRSKEELWRGIFVIEESLKSEDNLDKARKLVEERKVLEGKLGKFEDDLKEIIINVELGNNLRGKCRYCPA